MEVVYVLMCFIHVCKICSTVYTDETKINEISYLLAVQSVLQGQVSLTAVNHMYVFYEVMNGCKSKRFITALL